jgi:hypothetical protein
LTCCCLPVQSSRLRVGDACAVIGTQGRQVLRLHGLRKTGPRACFSSRRGKRSNHRLPAEVRTLALSTVREQAADFGPILAAMKLAASPEDGTA